MKKIESKIKFNYVLGSLVWIILLFTACNSTQKLNLTSANDSTHKVDDKKLSGGSSGMEQISDTSYIVVYDLKSHKKGVRLGYVNLTDESITVLPIEVDSWGEEGLSSDLEGICAIPGRDNEFLIIESGNWQGKLGRIFHIQTNINSLTAKVLGSVKFPLLSKNDFDLEGDQYEAIHFLAYTENERILILGERGGSIVNPLGILRWGIWDIKNNTLTIEGEGLKGIKFDAPGNWSNNQLKRSITDMHVDHNDIIWASASEEKGDTGPFYSVIYKLGKINPKNYKNPITIFDELSIGKEIFGFKIEALSGPKNNIDCTLTFGTEDEIYGGVWRPINIISN